MIAIEKTLVSEEILEEEFVCNIAQCKGSCCVAGEAGAPLEAEEVGLLKLYENQIKAQLNTAAKSAIARQGVAIVGVNGDWETPLVNGKECAYTVFTDSGVAQCGIELAHKAGTIPWLKPISCHLYPIRVQTYSAFSAVNYHRWDICSAACAHGKTLKVPVFQFLKVALIRKFGIAWFKRLEEVALQHRNGNDT